LSHGITVVEPNNLMAQQRCNLRHRTHATKTIDNPHWPRMRVGTNIELRRAPTELNFLNNTIVMTLWTVFAAPTERNTWLSDINTNWINSNAVNP
jgi:hypothetical protein